MSEESNIRHVNYASDFRVVFAFPDNKLPTYPWRLDLKTIRTPAYNAFTASFDGQNYTNCLPLDDKSILVLVNNHHLSPGTLCYRMIRDVPDDLFPDGEMNVTTPGCTSIELWDGVSEELPVEQINTIIATLKGGVPAGGTTGQVLTKNSDGDFDTQWSGPVPGRVVESSNPEVGTADVFGLALSEQEGVKPGAASHAEGGYTFAPGEGAHAEGGYAVAKGMASHAEGMMTRAVGEVSHAEGLETEALGTTSHAEGSHTVAAGHYSHAGGSEARAEGMCSFAHGDTVTAVGYNQAVFGAYNAQNPDDIFQVGAGDSINPKNVLAIRRDGDIRIPTAPGAEDEISLQGALSDRPTHKAAQRMARTTPQPVVREIMHETVFFRPKGHVFYVAPDANMVQVAGIMPNRPEIQRGAAKEISEPDEGASGVQYTVPVFDPHYVESMSYNLQWDPDRPGCFSTGTIRVKLNVSTVPVGTAIRIHECWCSVRIGDDGDVIGESGPYDHPVELPHEALLKKNGVVLLDLNGGHTLHVRILLRDFGIYTGKYVRIDGNHRFEVIGTPSDVSLPYVGRINVRSPKTAHFPCESLYAQIVAPSLFVAGWLFSGSESPDEITIKLGFGDALNKEYGLFVRMSRRRGARYVLCREPLADRFGPPFAKQSYKMMRRVLKSRTAGGLFRISYIDCCIARKRHLRTDVPSEFAISMDMNYPRFYFRLRAVRCNRHIPDGPTGSRGFVDEPIWKAVLK